MVARLFGSACTDERTTNETETLVFYVRQHLWMDHEPRSSLFVARSVLFVSCKARLFFFPKIRSFQRIQIILRFTLFVSSNIYVHTYTYIRTYIHIHTYIYKCRVPQPSRRSLPRNYTISRREIPLCTDILLIVKHIAVVR